jgi:hypothetical protein
MAEYLEMCSSFIDNGFTTDICEYLYVDNINQNTFEAYAGLNRFLREAKGKYTILCHQDILLKDHGIADLRARILEVGSRDPNWALLGNAGGTDLYHTPMRITYGDGNESNQGRLPARVHSLDENFILVRKDTNVALSGDLQGFHLYGTDLCLIAECMGYNAYVIDFNLIHLSYGNADEYFHKLSEQLQIKYTHFFRGRYIRTTITRFYLSSSMLLNKIMNLGFIKSIVRVICKLKKTGGSK